MKNLLKALFMTLLITTSSTSYAEIPNGSEYLDGGDSASALILLHGKGKHPTWKVVEPLRNGVNDKLGYHTLSLQMPNDDKNWKQYADDFPQAFETIKQGIRFLKDEKKVTNIYLMGHSMGSRMASAFVSENPDIGLKGLIVVGCRNNGSEPLSCMQNLQNVNIPVLDIWGGKNSKDSDAASDRESLVSNTFTQVEIPGANHKFDDYDDELISAVVSWLQAQK